jgi:hypothetical protein
LFALVRSDSAGGSRSSENVSFRLNKDQLYELRSEAKQKRISLNTLVSQVVDSYVNYTSNISKSAAIPVSRLTLMVLLEGYTEYQIKTMAHKIVNMSGKDATLMFQGFYDFEAVLKTFESWLRAADFAFSHIKTTDANRSKHTFVINHTMGRKYSVFAAESFKAYFEPVITQEVVYSITDKVISISVEGA